MPVKKIENIETLDVLTNNINQIDKTETEDESDTELELKVPIKKKIYNVKPKDPNAPKKERTPAQIKAWNRAIETRQARRDDRKSENEKVAMELEKKKEQAKKAVEEKIVKKAISIKKKQIKKEVILDEISDDDTPIETIKQIVRKQPSRNVKTEIIKQEPAYVFI